MRSLPVLWMFRLILLPETDGFRPVILYFCMQFVQIIPHTEQKNLQSYFRFPTKQKSLEFIIIFQNSEYPFRLDRTVHTIQNPFFAQDIFIRFLSLF